MNSDLNGLVGEELLTMIEQSFVLVQHLTENGKSPGNEGGITHWYMIPNFASSDFHLVRNSSAAALEVDELTTLAKGSSISSHWMYPPGSVATQSG